MTMPTTNYCVVNELDRMAGCNEVLGHIRSCARFREAGYETDPRYEMRVNWEKTQAQNRAAAHGMGGFGGTPRSGMESHAPQAGMAEMFGQLVQALNQNQPRPRENYDIHVMPGDHQNGNGHPYAPTPQALPGRRPEPVPSSAGSPVLHVSTSILCAMIQGGWGTEDHDKSVLEAVRLARLLVDTANDHAHG